MFILNLLRRLFTKNTVDESMPCSIVLLLRQPHYFTFEELIEAGQLGFGKRFDGDEDPMYFVVQTSPVTMIKAGSNAMHVLHRNRPYLENKEETAKQLLLKSQQDAWRAHNAWASIDMLIQEASNSDAYGTLARFALHICDSNCSAVFLPKHNVLLTNDGQAEEWLHGLIRGDENILSQVR